jgi:lipopolysaccharide transport protein LptA
LQESSADRTRATFAGRTNTLRELVQTGNFRFKDDTFEASAMNATFEEEGTVVTIDGLPVVTDAEKRLEADQIRLNRKDNSFVATKNVRTVFSSAGAAPVLVKAARAEASADTMLYTGSVELWRDGAYIKAESIRATSLGKTNRLYAEGRGNSKVQTDFNSIRATSDTLDYDEGRGVARYKGNVRARKQDMILETPDLTLTLAAGKTIAEITASDGVVVNRGNQRGFGSQAVYKADTDSVTLTGSPAKVHDNNRATIEGARLTMKSSGEVVIVEGGKGGRTVTTHPVQKK